MAKYFHDHGRKGQDAVGEWIWHCCYCGDSGQTSFHKSCPMCQHKRCDRCRWECIKISIEEMSFDQGVGFDGSPRIGVASHLNPSPSLSRPFNIDDNIESAAIPTHQTGQRRRRNKKTRPLSEAEESSRSDACPFNKRSPLIYNPWTGDSRYLKCLYPNPSTFRHIYDHLRDYHLLHYFICQRCQARFKNKRDLLQHQNLFSTCPITPRPECDGIDLQQLDQIRDIIKERTNRNKTPGERWFEIWDITSSGAQRPYSTYSEPPIMDISSFLSYIEYNTEFNYDTGVLKREENCHNVWMDTVRRAVESSNNNFLGTETEPTTFDNFPNNDITVSLPQTTSQENEFEHRWSNGADDQKFLGNSSVIFETYVNKEVHEFDYSDFFTEEKSYDAPFRDTFTHAPELRQLAPKMTQEPTPVHQPAALEGSSWLPKSEPNFNYTNVYASQIDPSIAEPSLNLEDFLTEAHGLDDGYDDSHTQNPGTISKISLEFSNDCIPFPTPEEGDSAMYPSDFNSIEGLLSFESALPHANGNIKNIRDMNRGLRGRYGFDCSM